VYFAAAAAVVCLILYFISLPEKKETKKNVDAK
jgi:hypothetical protein